MKDRRYFLKSLLGVLALGAAFFRNRPAFAKKLGFGIDKAPSLSKVGGSATLKLSGQEFLVVRASDTDVKALSPDCTHQKCRVKYNSKTSKVDCSCHGSSFDLNGTVLKGPAPKSLKTYPAVLKDGMIIISVD